MYETNQASVSSPESQEWQVSNDFDPLINIIRDTNSILKETYEIDDLNSSFSEVNTNLEALDDLDLEPSIFTNMNLNLNHLGHNI